MASIRTIALAKDAKIKWDTGKLRTLVYDHDRIKEIWDTEIDGKLKINAENHSIRDDVYKFVVELVKSGKIHDMQTFCDYIMAVRLTHIEENESDENGNLKIWFIALSIPEWEKTTFWNITWHINHHCKQLWNVCLVQITRGYDNQSLALSYTTGEDKDREFSMDCTDIRKSDEAKKLKEYVKKKKE